MKTNNYFRTAVEQCPDLKEGYRPGMQALKNEEAGKISVPDTKSLNGSVNIDACTKAIYPEANRWDYALGYKGKAYFVEIHPAYTSEISTMVKKKKWLEAWLASRATALRDIRAEGASVYWLFTGKCGILKTSPQYRQLAQEKILPCARLLLTDK